jgi:hypothetical protein
MAMPSQGRFGIGRVKGVDTCWMMKKNKEERKEKIEAGGGGTYSQIADNDKPE